MNKKSSIDGFVPRQRGNQMGGYHAPLAPGSIKESPSDARTSLPNPKLSQQNTGLESPREAVSRMDIDASLSQIDASTYSTLQKKTSKKPLQRKKIIKRVLTVLGIVVIIGIGWMGYKTLMASNHIFKGDIFGLVQNQPLKMDENGRSNILILGTSEDDPGHEASWLTDSIMIISLDQKAKNAYMFSIPRDLEVEYGRACIPGYAGKINAFFHCVNDNYTSPAAEEERQLAIRQLIGNVTGLDIQYSARVNYTVMRDLVKAVDGITVTIESPDPRGQMDGNFDWKCGATRAERLRNCPPRGHFIDYPNGPVNLDAEHALYLAQARGDTDISWGFPNSNFEREKNQQKIVIALKEKATSIGTLTNFGKVTSIIDALGNNLRTNFETKEIRTLIELGNTLPSTAIKSIDLLEEGVMTTSAQPTAGKYSFAQLRALIKKKMNATPVTEEGAKVILLNGSGIAGAAQREADKLASLGMNVTRIGNAPTNDVVSTQVYQISRNSDAAKDKSASRAKLEQLFASKVLTTAPPVPPELETNFIIILGKAQAVEAATQ